MPKKLFLNLSSNQSVRTFARRARVQSLRIPGTLEVIVTCPLDVASDYVEEDILDILRAVTEELPCFLVGVLVGDVNELMLKAVNVFGYSVAYEDSTRIIHGKNSLSAKQALKGGLIDAVI